MQKKHRKVFYAVVSVLVLALSLGCQGLEKRSRVQEGAALGGGLGTVIGAGAGQASALGGGPGALVGLSLGTTTGILTHGHYYDDPEERAIDPDELEELQTALQDRDQSIAALEAKLQEKEAQQRALLEATQEMQEEGERPQIQMGDDVQLSAHGMGTYMATIVGDVVFDSGRASISSDGSEVLSRAAEEIRREFPDAYIEVRGHTDNVPITHSDWESNWELSAARANNVLRYMVNEHGFREDRISAAYFADTRPVASNDTEDGRRKNRRAEIVIIPEDSEAARELERN